MLFENQKRMSKLIEMYLNQQDLDMLIIQGSQGIGKKYTIFNTLISINHIILDPSKRISKQHAMFWDAINTFPPSVKEIFDNKEEFAKDLPAFKYTASTLLSLHKKIKSKKNLNDNEESIFSYFLRYIQRSENVVISIYDIEKWESEDIFFLEEFVKEFSAIKHINVKWIVTCKQNKSANSIKDSYLTICKKNSQIEKFNDLRENEFVNGINWFYKPNTFNYDEKKLLYQIIGSDISALKILCKNFNSELIKTDSDKYQLIKKIIELNLTKLGADGLLIIKTMEYISILNFNISVKELEYVFEESERNIRNIVDKANKYSLLKYEDKTTIYIEFALEIVRKIYIDIKNDNIESYLQLEKCYKHINPSEYCLRGDLLLEAKELEQAGILYCMACLKELREKACLSHDLRKKLEITVSQRQKDFVIGYEKAIKYINRSEYKKASFELKILSDIDEELLIEKNILLSLCLVKYLDTREEAFSILDRYDNIEIKELDLYERLLERKIFTYIHNGNIIKAQDVEEKLINSLSRRSSHDKNALLQIIKLETRSNSMYSAEISLKKNINAMNKYSNYNIQNIRQQYIIITNLSCAYILNGMFDESYHYCENMVILMNEDNYIDFPRKEIIYNNYILSGLLSKKIDVNTCLQKYDELLENIKDGAEKLFYVSNYSILLAIHGDYKKAYKTLKKEATKQEVGEYDKESLYNFRVCFNLLAFSYLRGKHKNVKKYTNEIKKCSISKIDKQYQSEKIRIILKIVKENTKLNGEELLYAILDKEKEFNDKPWKYYGLGYSFTALSNWNDF